MLPAARLDAARTVLETARRLGYKTVRVSRSTSGKLRIRIVRHVSLQGHQRSRRDDKR